MIFMGWDQIGGLLGLGLGALGGLFGLWYGRRKAALKNGLDERYERISIKSLASGWKIILVSIYFLFLLVILGFQFSAIQVLGILLLIHMAGWTFSVIFYNLRF